MVIERIGIAMSGGVDSTACALKLRELAEVEGFFMRLDQPDFEFQLERVQDIAARLGIPLTVVDLRGEFQEQVLNYFAQTYFGGTTPNPCVVCNHQIKFGEFQKRILAAGMEKVATGHYARIMKDSRGYHLLDGVDERKNQSYFLSRLTQQQLAHTLFPLGELKKEEIFSFVKQFGFLDFDGVESQDICFLGTSSVADYLQQQYPEKIQPGPIVTTSGETLGTHEGLFRYTIGQRRGLGLPDATPWYVTAIDSSTNSLIVGKSDELLKRKIHLRALHWLRGGPPALDQSYTVRIRYSHRGSQAHIVRYEGDSCTLQFDEEQRAVTPGQFAVFYEKNEVLGSGIID